MKSDVSVMFFLCKDNNKIDNTKLLKSYQKR